MININKLYPIEGNRNFQMIKNAVQRENIECGDFSYYDAKNGESFAQQILYHYEILGDKLVIGKFSQIGPGVEFIMNGANHRMDGSTYPFHLLGNGWEKFIPGIDQLPYKGDTIIGNDVWIGKDAKIMPGIRIGDGAIIAAYSVVTADVKPYSVVGGNPAKHLKERFEKSVVSSLLKIRWWDFSYDVLETAIPFILENNIEALLNIKKHMKI